MKRIEVPFKDLDKPFALQEPTIVEAYLKQHDAEFGQNSLVVLVHPDSLDQMKAAVVQIKWHSPIQVFACDLPVTTVFAVTSHEGFMTVKYSDIAEGETPKPPKQPIDDEGESTDTDNQDSGESDDAAAEEDAAAEGHEAPKAGKQKNKNKKAA